MFEHYRAQFPACERYLYLNHAGVAPTSRRVQAAAASWFEDLVQRITFMQGWVEKYPDSYWVPAFFFPQGFFTSVKQKFARKTQTPIDTIEFNTNFQGYYSDNVTLEPEHGCIIHGLFFEGCRFDMDTMLL